MVEKVAELRGRLRRLEHELDAAIEAVRERAAGDGTHRPGRLSDVTRRDHRRLRTGLLSYLRGVRLTVLMVAPVLYAVIVPLALLDLMVTVYQRVGFPVFGIRPVRRADYIAIDRHRLGYLNAIEKLNCVYCGYANGVIAYAREIASRTEQYWCPIKHAKLVRGAHRRYPGFLDYGDAEGYRGQLDDYRRKAGES